MLQGQQSPLRLERGLRGGNVLRDELGGLWGQVHGWQQPGRLGSRGSSVGVRREAAAPEQSATRPDLGLGALPVMRRADWEEAGTAGAQRGGWCVIQVRGQGSWRPGPGRGSGGVCLIGSALSESPCIPCPSFLSVCDFAFYC